MKREEEIDKVIVSDRKCPTGACTKRAPETEWKEEEQVCANQTNHCALQAWPRELCLTAEGGTGLTKNYGVKYMRKNLIQTLRSKFEKR